MNAPATLALHAPVLVATKKRVIDPGRCYNGHDRSYSVKNPRGDWRCILCERATRARRVQASKESRFSAATKNSLPDSRKEWRSVVGYEGLYVVSNEGDVFSLPSVRTYDRGDGHEVSRVHKGRLLTCTFGRGTARYPKVTLSKGGQSESKHVHTLVAEAFIGPRPLGMVVRHLDDVPQNNHISNLAYGTSQENRDDAQRNGRYLRGERHPNSKLTSKKVREIRSSKERKADLAQKYGVSESAIDKIRRRQVWPAA